MQEIEFFTNEELRKMLNEIFQNVNENYKLRWFYEFAVEKLKREWGNQVKKEIEKTDKFYGIDIIEDACSELKKARFAISEIINEYETPCPCKISPQKAVDYGKAKEKYKDDPSYYYSWKYCSEYEKLMWLANIILDYTYLANERLENILEKDN